MVQFERLALCAVMIFAAVPALAQQAPTPFKPEQLSVKGAIDPGPNLLIHQQEWKGAGSTAVFSKDDLSFKGLMTAGNMAQMLVGVDGKTAYTQSTFMKRITYGDLEHVLQIFDIATLSPVKEVILPPKAAMSLGYAALLQQSADGKFVYVQNGTPASSVTVVDVTKAAVTQEIPTPGCWGIYPSSKGYKFTSLCGTGTVTTFNLTPAGTLADSAQSAKVFDPDKDPLYITSATAGDDRLFPSYNGSILRISDADKAAKLVESVKINEGIEGNWAPGGYAPMGYSEKTGVVFVGMHADAKNGSHKNAAEEIWAYDLKAKKLLSRTPVEHIMTITVTNDDVPVVFGLTEDPKVIRFTADPKAGFALNKTGEAKLTGYPYVAAVTP